MSMSSSREMFCHAEIAHRQVAPIASPAMIAAVFLRTFSREKIKIWAAVVVVKGYFAVRIATTAPEFTIFPCPFGEHRAALRTFEGSFGPSMIVRNRCLAALAVATAEPVVPFLGSSAD